MGLKYEEEDRKYEEYNWENKYEEWKEFGKKGVKLETIVNENRLERQNKSCIGDESILREVSKELTNCERENKLYLEYPHQ